MSYASTSITAEPLPLEEFYWLIWSYLPMCGCGQPDEVLFRLYGILEWLATPHQDRNHDALDQFAGSYWVAQLLVQCWEQSEDLMRARDIIKKGDTITEHGGSSLSGWLCDYGDRVLASFRLYGWDPDEVDKARNQLWEAGNAGR